MLVVTRRLGKFPIIDLPTGKLVEVTVVRFNGKQVRLATAVPKQLLVMRVELPERGACPAKKTNRGPYVA